MELSINTSEEETSGGAYGHKTLGLFIHGIGRGRRGKGKGKGEGQKNEGLGFNLLCVGLIFLLF